ncbi:hypothetical protein ERJ75_001131000 [Trypanosoma vivax]|nr:hypothetical protein ERJ75_001131000 [Trypanosoma vivax]
MSAKHRLLRVSFLLALRGARARGQCLLVCVWWLGVGCLHFWCPSVSGVRAISRLWHRHSRGVESVTEVVVARFALRSAAPDRRATARAGATHTGAREEPASVSPVSSRLALWVDRPSSSHSRHVADRTFACTLPALALQHRDLPAGPSPDNLRVGMGPSTARASAVSASTAATPLTRLCSCPGPKAAGRCLQRHAVAGCRPCGVRRGAVRCTAFAQSEGMGICRRSLRVASSGEGTNGLTRACDLAQGFVVKEMHTALRLVCFLALACGACSGTAPAGLAAGTALKMCTLTATLLDLARHAVIVAKEAARRHANVLANAALFEAAGLNCTGGSDNALQEACAQQALVEAAKAPLQQAHGNAVGAAATLHRGAGMATEYISVLASFAVGGGGSGKACLLSTKAITTPGSNPNIQDTLAAITDTHNGNAKTCSNLFKHKERQRHSPSFSHGQSS